MALTALAVLALGGCGGEGPAIQANPQTISFAAAPTPAFDQSTVTVSATASSGLPVSFRSITPAVCSVNSGTGVVTGLTSGICTIAANQSGNSHYTPASQVTQNITFSFSHTINFTALPNLGLYDSGTVTAVDSTGQNITCASATPTVCSISGTSGLVTALATGECAVTATGGALQATRTISITAPSAVTVPGSPSGVTVTLGDTNNSVSVNIGAIVSGGSPITGFTVTSTPAGITATGSSFPITLTCPVSCAGYAFTVTATNAVGTGPSSSLTDIVTNYKVVETFHEPDTQPNDSIFVGTFTLNSTTGAVSNLRGVLSESMTGGSTPYPNDTMTWLTLSNQLSSVYDSSLGGLLVTTFLLPSTNTLSNNPIYGGTDGWTPGTGSGLYYGYKGGINPHNAYARIFVNTINPTATLTQDQVDKLAYADCAPGGMMGGTCMTGTSVAGYGTEGTMGGYPVSQVITKQP